MARTKRSPVSLAGKVVAVTGGARGIGRATAEAFLDQGAKVAVGDVDVELAEKTAAELGARPGAEIVGLPLDVTDRASFATFLDEAEKQLGSLDVVVNNAGIMPTGLLADEADSMTDRIIDVNLRGVITGSKLAVARFTPRGTGSIVNIASLAGVTGYPGLATYCGTKHAVLGFTEALYGELRDTGVSVSAVLPGVVRTELSAGTKMPQWAERITTVDPSDVAQAVVTAVTSGKPRVVVPKSAAGMLKSMGLMSGRAKYAVARALKFDVAFTEADPALREAYHRRISGGKK